MLSLASPWPTLNEPVLSLSCIIMNIHLSVCENLCVCVCVMHWQAWRKLLLYISITIHHFAWIISQADNSSTYHHSQTKQALFWGQKKSRACFQSCCFFTPKSNVASQGYLTGSHTIVCLHTYTHASHSPFHSYLMKAQDWRKKEKLEYPLCHLGRRSIDCNTVLNTSDTQKWCFCTRKGHFQMQPHITWSSCKCAHLIVVVNHIFKWEQGKPSRPC